MIWSPRRHLVTALTLAAALVLTGCQPPEPTADDIVAYARNGAVGAEVRYLGPTAQQYVEQVFQAYGPWHESFSPVAHLTGPKSLWPVDSPLWHDAEAVDAQRKTIQQWRADAPQRKQLHDELLTAIDAVPAAYRADAVRIRAQVAKVLDETQPKRIDAIVRLYESLFSQVHDARGRFDPDAPGLALRDPQTTAQARQLYRQLRTLLDEIRADELNQIDWVLTSGRQSRRDALQLKQKLDRYGPNAEQALREIRRLDIDVLYYDKIIDEAEQRSKALAG